MLQNDRRAGRYFERAARQGHAHAQYKMGRLALDGVLASVGGTRLDVERAALVRACPTMCYNVHHSQLYTE